MKTINIDYLTASRLPTEKAHGHQILEMCQGLSKVVNVNLDLVLGERYNHLTDDIISWYGHDFNVLIKKIKIIDFYGVNIKSKILQKLNFFIINLSYLISFLMLKEVKNNSYYFVREPLLLLMLIPVSIFKRNKIIYEIHSLPENKYKRYIFCYFLKKIDFVITLTPVLKKILVLIYQLDKSKIIVLPDSVNESFITYKDNHLQDNETLKICYLGRISAKNIPKGVNDLLEAFSNIETPRMVEFHIYGAINNEIDDLLKISNSLLTKKNLKIFIHGNIKYSIVPIILSQYNILIGIYSTNDFHNRYCVSPLKIFEYMASGKLLITSDIPAFKLILLNDHNALLFKNNKISIIQTMTNAINNFNKYKKLGNTARKEVMINTWDLRAQKIIEFIN